MENFDGGPAFPITEQHGSNSGMPGMSLRQHYAGLLMQTEAMTCGVPGEACEALVKAAHDKGMDPMDPIDLMAQNAMDGADALIRASACPPQRVHVPFDPLKLTNDERAAMDRLVNWDCFDDLPEDVKANAKAVARSLKDDDFSIPF